MNNSLLVSVLNMKDIANHLRSRGYKVEEYPDDYGTDYMLVKGMFGDDNVDFVVNRNGTWYVHDRK